MENFELIEKYIGGRLGDSEKQAFEKQLQADPSLQNDVALQKQIIEGIKKARITEIKAMLNQVPVGGAMPSGVLGGKIIIGIVTVGAVVTSSLLYFNPWEKPSSPVINTETPMIENKTEKPVNSVETTIKPKEDKITPALVEPPSKKEVVIPKSKAVQPKIDVVDPTEELTKTTDDKKNPVENKGMNVEPSHILTEIDNSNSKYSFHYQFTQGKLILYGNFDKGLYEILEVHGDAHAVFLYYKGDYYALREKQSSIIPLTQIKDTQLIKKLKEYRSR